MAPLQQLLNSKLWVASDRWEKKQHANRAKALRTGSKKETREGDSIKKVRKGGKVDVEPRLNRKKHRRTSRKLSKQQFKQAVMEDDWD